MSGVVESRLVELGLVLPKQRGPAGSYVFAKRAGNLLFLSGKGPVSADGRPFVGKVGETVSADEAYLHARLVGLELIAAMREELGDLDRVRDIVKVFGVVNAAPTFAEHPKVINGCSDLFVEVFGERGRHARTAAGASSLPYQITVEIEAVALIADH